MSYYLLVIMYQEKAKGKKIKIKVQNKQWWPKISLKDCDSSSKSMSLTYSSVTYKWYNWWILTILPNQRIMRLNNNRIILSDERWDQKKIRQKKKFNHNITLTTISWFFDINLIPTSLLCSSFL